MNIIAEDIRTHWSFVRPLLSIRDEHEYNLAIERLNALIDEIGTDEHHPLYELLDTLGTIINAYEESYHPMPESDGIEMLQFLMEEHQLGPSDLLELGTTNVVWEILNGERELTINNLRALAERFGVSPTVFL